jgi:transglutaminase-like putative cysteine protease
MAKFKITHLTSYQYSDQVIDSEHYFFDKAINDQFQKVLSYNSLIKVNDKNNADKSVKKYTDPFGNNICYFLNKNHSSKLDFLLDIEVETDGEYYKENSAKFDDLKNQKDDDLYLPFYFNKHEKFMLSPYLEIDYGVKDAMLKTFVDLAKSFKGNALKKVEKILSHINSKYKYDISSANVDNSPFHLFAEEKGVCHDFTNFFITIVRVLGIPARFCCGYNYRNENFAHQLHSWAEIYIPKLGWLGFDPSRGIIIDENYIKLSHGIDYFDCAPVRGIIFNGGDGETLNVEVSVQTAS